MLQFIKSYFTFLWQSKDKHGIHSPFVFDLVTKCFYDKSIYVEYSILKNYRKSLLANKDHIDVTDIGVGSRIFKSYKRQISKIAKTAGISEKRANLLFRMVQYFQPESILEIGTSLGLATSALALGNKKAIITTLEGCMNTMLIAKKTFAASSSDLRRAKIAFLNTEFLNYLKTNSQQFTTSNLIYFDGNHSCKATLEYFDLLLPTATNDSVWIFDDIHWSIDMELAWKTIQNHPKVTVTIDTFQWGIVFFRSAQTKENFVIRI